MNTKEKVEKLRTQIEALIESGEFTLTDWYEEYKEEPKCGCILGCVKYIGGGNRDGYPVYSAGVSLGFTAGELKALEAGYEGWEGGNYVKYRNTPFWELGQYFSTFRSSKED